MQEWRHDTRSHTETAENKTHLFRTVSSSLPPSSHHTSQVCLLLPSSLLSPKAKSPSPGSVSCLVFPPALKPETVTKTLQPIHCHGRASNKIPIRSRHSLLKTCQWLPTALKINSRLFKIWGPFYLFLSCASSFFSPTALQAGPPPSATMNFSFPKHTLCCHLTFCKCWVPVSPPPSQNAPGHIT